MRRLHDLALRERDDSKVITGAWLTRRFHSASGTQTGRRTSQFVIARVDVVLERRVDVLVPEDLLHQRNVNNGTSEPGGERVPEVMRIHLDRNFAGRYGLANLGSELPNVVPLAGARDEQRTPTWIVTITKM